MIKKEKIEEAVEALGGLENIKLSCSDVYCFYGKVCKYLYSLKKNSAVLNSASRALLNDLETRSMSLYSGENNVDLSARHLASSWKQIQLEWDSPSPRIIRNRIKNYDVYGGQSLRNIVYVSHLTDKSLSGVRDYLIKTGIKSIVESFWSTHIGACNVRAYRYTHDSPVENTHFEEDFDLHGSIEPHYDGIAGHPIKIMILKNGVAATGPLLLEHGVPEVQIDNEWLPVVDGTSCATLVFTANTILHRARQPAKGLVRDCIEITLIPRLEDDFLVVSAGAHSGSPLNPFKDWSVVK